MIAKSPTDRDAFVSRWVVVDEQRAHAIDCTSVSRAYSGAACEETRVLCRSRCECVRKPRRVVDVKCDEAAELRVAKRHRWLFVVLSNTRTKTRARLFAVRSIFCAEMRQMWRRPDSQCKRRQPLTTTRMTRMTRRMRTVAARLISASSETAQ